MNPIQAYLTGNGVRVEQYAELARYSKEAIYKFIAGERKPRRHRLKSLSDASGGAITVESLEAAYYPQATHD
jgi:hypothetical protein